MNSKKVREAVRRASEKLSNLTDEEFQRQLALHVDGDIAKALLDLHYFEVGRAESDAFEFEVEEIPNVASDWYTFTFEYTTQLFNNLSTAMRFAPAGFTYAAQILSGTYINAAGDTYLSYDYNVETPECEPWRLAA